MPPKWEVAPSVSVDGATARVQRLAPSSTYVFRVSAVNSAGSSEFSETVSVRLGIAPLQPPVLRAVFPSAGASDSAFLAWGQPLAAPETISPATTPKRRGSKARTPFGMGSSRADLPPTTSECDSSNVVYELQETTIPNEPVNVYRGTLCTFDLGMQEKMMGCVNTYFRCAGPLDSNSAVRTFRIRRCSLETESAWSSELRVARDTLVVVNSSSSNSNSNSKVASRTTSTDVATAAASSWPPVKLIDDPSKLATLLRSRKGKRSSLVQRIDWKYVVFLLVVLAAAALLFRFQIILLPTAFSI